MGLVTTRPRGCRDTLKDKKFEDEAKVKRTVFAMLQLLVTSHFYICGECLMHTLGVAFQNSGK